MSEQTFYRAALDIKESDGRTLTGRAFFFNVPSRVQDPTGPPYWESFSRASVNKTLKEHDVFPLFDRHDYSKLPVGAVRFIPAEDGLDFEARLSATAASDEMKSLVDDGAMRSVSVGFFCTKSGKQVGPNGPITVRQEIGLRELSLAPTGFGQHQGAEILAVRHKIETPRLAALRKKLVLL